MFRKTAAPQGNKSQKNNAAVSTKAGAAYDLVPAGRDASETTFAVFTASLQQFVFFFLWFGIQKKTTTTPHNAQSLQGDACHNWQLQSKH